MERIAWDVFGLLVPDEMGASGVVHQRGRGGGAPDCCRRSGNIALSENFVPSGPTGKGGGHGVITLQGKNGGSGQSRGGQRDEKGGAWGRRGLKGKV